MKNNSFSVTFLIPSLNSEKFLPFCLESIRAQDYPKELIETIVIDGGSKDKTIEIARNFGAKVLFNPLKTGEAGKAKGVKSAQNEILAFVDSDNILAEREWLRKMLTPFTDQEIIASEPISFTYRPKDHFITRYSALLGMNDPLCLFLGNYDRSSYLTGKWTEIPHIEEEKGDYLKVKFKKGPLPTIGANGFLIRKDILLKTLKGDYLFDVDILHQLLSLEKVVTVAKVKIGIIHIFADSISSFIRKQKRRIKDYLYYKKMGLRKYPWSSLSKFRVLKFIIYTLLFFPLIFQSVKGYWKKKDLSWFFHPLACYLTVIIYSSILLKNYLKK